MEFTQDFKFLKFESVKRKNAEELAEDERYFVILSCLDTENNPVRFMIFDYELVKSIQANKIASLQDITLSLKLVFSNNIWNVRVLDILHD